MHINIYEANTFKVSKSPGLRLFVAGSLTKESQNSLPLFPSNLQIAGQQKEYIRSQTTDIDRLKAY